MHRWHIVVSDELAGRVAEHLDGRPLSVFVRGAVEQALGSSGRAGVRGRVPASAPAEQPGGVYVGPEVEAAALAEQPHRFIEAPASVADVDVILGKAAEGLEFNRPRVRSSSVARPFRPAPKQGKK